MKPVSESDRLDITMRSVGSALGRYKVEDGQQYPLLAFVGVLEASEEGDEMLNGLATSVFYGRGVVWRGRGGQQEYDLAEKYEAISRELRGKAPRTSEMFSRLASGYRMDGAREDEREQRIEDGIDTCRQFRHQLRGTMMVYILLFKPTYNHIGINNDQLAHLPRTWAK